MTTDRLSGIVCVVFALFVISETRSLPIGTVRQPGPAFVPILIALLLCGLAVVLVAIGGRSRSFFTVSWPEWSRAAAILVASLFSTFGIERFGYRFTLLLALIFLLGVIEKRGWVLTILFAFTLSFGSYLLFDTVLRVPLPEGPLGF